MMKYVICWLIIETVAAPCPDPSVKVDEFGRMSCPQCITKHDELLNVNTVKMKKVFERPDSADAFINRLILESKKKDSNITGVYQTKSW